MKEKGKRILTLVLAMLMVFTSIWPAPVAARAEMTQAEVEEVAETVEGTEKTEEPKVSDATEAEETQEETEEAELEETVDIPEVSEPQEADQESATPVALENAGENGKASELPEVGYYTAPVANEGNYISEFNLTDTSDTFYFVAKDDWEILKVEPADECKDILDVQLDPSRKYATVKVTGEVTDSETYCNLYYEAQSADGYIGGGSNTAIPIRNQRARLGFYWGDYDENYGLVADLDGEFVQT